MSSNRLSVTSFPFMNDPLEVALDKCAAAGFANVELLGKLPHLSLDPNQSDPAVVRDKAAQRGLRIANLATYGGAGFVGDDPAEQEREYEALTRAIDVAAALGARSIRVFRVDAKFDLAENIERIAPWYAQAAVYAAELNVYMGIENHGGGISGSAQACVELCRKVASPFFGVLYDPCNLLNAGVDHKAALDVMRDHIVHVHIKDGTGEPRSQQTTMLGDGKLDLPWVMNRLADIGYAHEIAIEYELKTVPPEVGLPKWREMIERHL